jgi:hypothetical protein
MIGEAYFHLPPNLVVELEVQITTYGQCAHECEQQAPLTQRPTGVNQVGKDGLRPYIQAIEASCPGHLQIHWPRTARYRQYGERIAKM